MKRRITAYSHDAMGLGHLRRTLSICRHLTDRDPESSALILTGSSFAQAFGTRDRIDFLNLPSARKIANGHYEARYLGVDFPALTRLRAGVIDESLRAFEPQVLIVDKTAGGMGGELLPALERLRTADRPVKIVLGLRDILDEPRAQIREWNASGELDMISRYYDAVWIYGSPEVFDAVREYEFPDELAAMTTYLGYLPKYNGLLPASVARKELGAGDRPIAMVTAGGGEDGYDLLDLYVSALEEGLLRPEFLSVLVTGPGMPSPRVAELRGRVDRLAPHSAARLIEFSDHLTSLLAVSEVVVTMGGYNTLTEALCLGRRIVSVPRRRPRLEQWIRAERLAARGLLTLLEPEDATPRSLARALDTELGRTAPAASVALDFSGFERLGREFDRLLQRTPTQPRPTPSLWSHPS